MSRKDEEDDSDTKSDSSDEAIAEPQDQIGTGSGQNSLDASEAFSHTSSQLLASSLKLNELLSVIRDVDPNTFAVHTEAPGSCDGLKSIIDHFTGREWDWWPLDRQECLFRMGIRGSTGTVTVQDERSSRNLSKQV